jgi:hypothetical protein
MRWVVDREQIQAALEEQGFDVDTSDASLPEGGGSLSARTDRGEHIVVLKVDSGGRLLITESEVLDDRAGDPVVIGDVKLTVTERSTRRRSYRGAVRELSQLQAILKALLATKEVTDEAVEPPPV